MNRWKRNRFALGAAGAVALAIIALVVVATTRSGSARAPDFAVPAAAGSGVSADSVARFTLTSLDGQRVSRPSTGRPGALFFTVSSCGSCIPSAQALSTLKSQLGQRVDALLVDLDPGDSPQGLRALGDAVGRPAYPLAIDSSGSLVNVYRVQALGTTVVYNARGRIVERLIDPNMTELRQAFRKAGVA